MEWKDEAFSYLNKYEQIETQNDNNWFKVYRLQHNIYAIKEPHHVQGVNLYLIIGKEKALLFDTGLGFVPIKPLIEELYDGEIVVVNSHFHFDHTGNNHTLEPVYCYEDEYVKAVATNGLKTSDYADQLDEEMFRYGYPKGFDPKGFSLNPYKYIPIEEGDCFDLGDRVLQVVHTPGHSQDGISLFDKNNNVLFTGDTFYMGNLYAQFDCAQFGRSDIKEYFDSINKMISVTDKDTILYCSHNDFEAPRTKLFEAARLLNNILESKATNLSKADAKHQYLDDADALEVINGEGVNIIYKKLKKEANL